MTHPDARDTAASLTPAHRRTRAGGAEPRQLLAAQRSLHAAGIGGPGWRPDDAQVQLGKNPFSKG